MLYYSCKFMKINQGNSHGFIPCFPLFKASRAMDSLLVFPGVIFIMQQRNILIVKKKKKKDGKASKLPPTMTYERHYQVNKKKRQTKTWKFQKHSMFLPLSPLMTPFSPQSHLKRIHYMKSLIFSANNSINIRYQQVKNCRIK